MICYSTDDENFRYNELGEVFDAMDCDGTFSVGATYYEIATELVDLGEYLDADMMLETAEERAYEELGECAEDAFSTTPDAAAELDAALKSWAAKHLPKGYWRCVGKSTERKVTAEDVAERERGR